MIDGQIRFQLNDAEIAACAGETIIEAAQRHGVEIPHLCYTPGMRPDGNCRACMVEIKGERVLAPSCCRTPTAGMEVSSTSARAVHSQKMVVEMLVADVKKNGRVFLSNVRHGLFLLPAACKTRWPSW